MKETNLTIGVVEKIKFVEKEQIINLCNIHATELWPNEVLIYLRE